jgi:uncharacterized protein YecE (DUF72 family)
MVGFHGRNAESWNKRVESAAERHRYHYSEPELKEWIPRVKELANKATETHALFANCYRDYAVRNASQLLANEGLPVKRAGAPGCPSVKWLSYSGGGS